MRPSAAIASALHLFMVLLLCLASLFSSLIAFSDAARLRFLLLVENDPAAFGYGAAALGIGALLLLINFYAYHKATFLLLKMGTHEAIVEARVIEQAIETLFPCPKVTLLRKKRLLIELPDTGLLEAAQAEKELEMLLKERFGYRGPFELKIRP
jgi:hypothetical protein